MCYEILLSVPPSAYIFECPRCSFVGRNRNAPLKHSGLSHIVVVALVRKEMGGSMIVRHYGLKYGFL